MAPRKRKNLKASRPDASAKVKKAKGGRPADVLERENWSFPDVYQEYFYGRIGLWV